jgi:hypothetical protein
MKVSLFKKIKLFFFYRRKLMELEKELYNRFFIRVDNASRMYTVLTIPEEQIDEPYRLRKQDIDVISVNFIKEYSSEVSKFLNANELQELYDWYETKKVDKYSYLLIFGFSLFKTDKVFRSLLIYWLPFILLMIISSFIYLNLK